MCIKSNFKSFVATSLLLSSSVVIAEESKHSLLDAVAKINDQKQESESSVYRQEIKEGLEKKGGIIGIKELPIKKLYFVEAEYGSYLVSPDGRFVIDGDIKDVWHRKTLKDLGDLKNLDRVPVTSNAKNLESSLATFQIGEDALPRSGVVFVDPTSEYTTTALKKLKSLEDTQKWVVVLMPVVGGSQALDRSRKLWCAKDKKLALDDLINGTNKSFSDLDSDCKENRLLAAQLVTNVFNIESLPHFIREDGLVSHGFPVKFESWYKQP